MIEKPCPILSMGPEAAITHSQRTGNLIHFAIDVPGRPLSFDVAIHRQRARLQDMVPLAWAVASRLNRATIDNIEQAGGAIACTKGCHACCSYMVSLSVPEVFRLQQDVLRMSAGQRETILRMSVESARRILDRKPSRSIGEDPDATDARITANRISRWYGRLGLPCVFLSDGECTFYSNRPLVCREHLAAGSSELCALGSAETPHIVAGPVSAVEALAQLTAELEESPVESIMLPFALAWAQDNVERSEKTWPAASMVERFSAILRDMTSENLSPDAVSA